MSEAKRRPATMRTFSGLMVNPLDPAVALADIAHALAGAIRFGGHSPRRYTVAQHSVTVSREAEAKARRRGPALRDDEYARVALYGLLHDAHEAYFTDIPSPLKGRLRELYPDFDNIEDDVQRRVLGAFGLECPLPLEVDEADRERGEYEYDHLWTGDLECLTMEEAEAAFLREFWLIQARIRRFDKED